MTSSVVALALAPAKINMGLEVIGRRPDGFHDICTIMQAVSIFDRISMIYPGSGQVVSNAANHNPEHNLVSVAARHLASTFGRQLDVDFRLEKRIPIAAGLGGGSSDAATTIRLLARRWDIAIDNSRVLDVAGATGSDVPFFLIGGRALAEGRGERVRPILEVKPFWIVVVVSPLEIPAKTATLYRALAPSDFSDGYRVRGVASSDHLPTSPMPNPFARPLYELCPELETVRSEMESISSLDASLSGAGPAHYLVIEGVAEAVRILWMVRSTLGIQAQNVHLARSLSGPGPISAAGNLLLP